MATTYVVTAPLAIVHNAEQGGRQEYLYAGSPLPSYVSADELTRLVNEGFVAASGEEAADAVSPVSSPNQLNLAVLVPLPTEDAEPVVEPAVEPAPKPESEPTSGSKPGAMKPVGK